MRLDRYWQQIEQNFQRGDSDTSLSMLEQLLAQYPSHIEGLCLLAEIMKKKGRHTEAERCLAAVQMIDPENEQAQMDTPAPLLPVPGRRRLIFGKRLSEASKALFHPRRRDENLEKGLFAKGIGRYREAARHFQMALAANPDDPMARLGLLESLWRSGSWQAAHTQALAILSVHPLWVKGRLILADISLDQGNDAEAAAYMHEAQSLDPSFSVARRLLRHSEFESSFMNLARRQTIIEAIDIKSDEGNRASIPSIKTMIALPRPQAASQPEEKTDRMLDNGDIRRELELVLSDLERLTEENPIETQKPEMVRPQIVQPWVAESSPSREAPKPDQTKENIFRIAQESEQTTTESILALVINRLRLRAKYGRNGWRKIEKALEEYVETLKAVGGYTIVPIYFDHSMTVADNDLAAQEVSAQIRLIFHSIAINRGESNPSLNYVLIIGSDDIVPAFRMPNGTGDTDPYVLSDNPYGTDDDNWLTPKWAVGRLPSANDDGTYLVNRIRDAIALHRQNTNPRIWRRLLSILNPKHKKSEPTSFGLAASIWRRSSRAVFKAIGNPYDLRLSPPVSQKEFIWGDSTPFSYQYYCLHGLANSNFWYGQRDPSMPADYAQFPVTLTPEMVPSSPMHQSIIFTSACYGLNIEDGSPEANLGRAFMTKQAFGVVGSTGIAYGGLEPPLVGADMLAEEFWRAIQLGMPVGLALQQAKLDFAMKTIATQEYLDWEDQKTLASFMLLGDPTLRSPYCTQDQNVAFEKLKQACLGVSDQPKIDMSEDGGLSETALRRVQEIVVNQVPIMAGSSLRIRQHIVNHTDVAVLNKAEANDPPRKREKIHYVITLEQNMTIDKDSQGQQLVRVTTNNDGSILKIIASR